MAGTAAPLVSIPIASNYAPMSTNEFDLKSIRLLLVEDNAADARVVERHLKDAGLNNVTSDWVQTAADAIERLQKVEYDLVLLDLGLPDASGLQALRALRAVADLTPIIVLTGSDDYKQGLGAVREGAQDYLEKRRVNAGMLSRVVSYSVERNTFHRDLVRATRRYQDLFNNVPVSLFTANHDGMLKTANAACVKLLSCQGIPLDKVNFLDLLFEPGKRAHFLDLMSSQRMVEGWETVIHDCKGKQLHVLVNTAPLYDSVAGLCRLGRLPHRHLDAQADARGARPPRGQPAPGAEARGHRPARGRHRPRDQHADAIRRRQPALPQGIVRRARLAARTAGQGRRRAGEQTARRARTSTISRKKSRARSTSRWKAWTASPRSCAP